MFTAHTHLLGGYDHFPVCVLASNNCVRADLAILSPTGNPFELRGMDLKCFHMKYHTSSLVPLTWLLFSLDCHGVVTCSSGGVGPGTLRPPLLLLGSARLRRGILAGGGPTEEEEGKLEEVKVIGATVALTLLFAPV